jgi:hypothetical protein
MNNERRDVNGGQTRPMNSEQRGVNGVETCPMNNKQRDVSGGQACLMRNAARCVRKDRRMGKEAVVARDNDQVKAQGAAELGETEAAVDDIVPIPRNHGVRIY